MKRNGNVAAFNMLGMALRGRNAVVGRESVRNAFRKRKAARVFMAEDAGNALVDEMSLLCEKHGVPMTVFGRKADLGSALGRAEVAVIALTDKGLAEAVCNKIEN